MGQVRFRDLVNKLGKPREVTLWTDPAADPQIARAIKENKILTITRGDGADFGTAGFQEATNALYFLFPKSLPIETGTNVIGIKYDLLEQPKTTDLPRIIRSNPIKKKKERIKPRPLQKTFNIVVRRVAVIEKSFSVEESTKAAAKQKAIQSINGEPFDLKEAVIQNQVRSIR